MDPFNRGVKTKPSYDPDVGPKSAVLQHPLPPQQHLEKFDGPMGDNPDDPARSDIELGNAAHAGTPPVH